MRMDDERWIGLEGGYRVPFDPRPLLARLEREPDDPLAWDALIEGLYHQGDVGEASYAAVPPLVAFGIKQKKLPWQMLALVAFIEMARESGNNPPVPEWIAPAYGQALSTLAGECMQQLPDTEEEESARGMLCLIALWKGFRVFARAVGDYTEQELAAILPD